MGLWGLLWVMSLDLPEGNLSKSSPLVVALVEKFENFTTVISRR